MLLPRHAAPDGCWSFNAIRHAKALESCIQDTQCDSKMLQITAVPSAVLYRLYEHAIHHRCMLCRHTVRQVYLTKQQRYHAALLDADSSFPYMNHRTSDDSVRFLSVFFALSKALDKAVLLARMACDDPWIKQQAGQQAWNQYRLWFGR